MRAGYVAKDIRFSQEVAKATSVFMRAGYVVELNRFNIGPVDFYQIRIMRAELKNEFGKKTQDCVL